MQNCLVEDIFSMCVAKRTIGQSAQTLRLFMTTVSEMLLISKTGLCV